MINDRITSFGGGGGVVSGGGLQDSIIVTQLTEEQVHLGNFYIVSKLFPSVGGGGTANFLINTGTIPVHIAFSVASEAETSVRLYEDVTPGSPAGTSANIFNANRTSSNTPLTTISCDAAYSGGTLISEILIPGGVTGGGNSDGGVGGGPARDNAEIILDVSSSYILEVTDESNQTVKMSISAGFYELALT